MSDLRENSPVILLVEDEPMILMELAFAVQDLGGTTVTATSVEKALRAIETTPPDAALLDFNLGRRRTCEPIGEELERLGIPYVLHSGDLMRQGEVIEKMGVEVIPKPSDSRDVARRVLALVRSQAAE